MLDTSIKGIFSTMAFLYSLKYNIMSDISIKGIFSTMAFLYSLKDNILCLILDERNIPNNGVSLPS